MKNSNKYLGHLLGVTSKALGRKATARVKEFNLSIQQFGVLNVLYSEDGLTSHELVDRLLSDSSSIMSLVDQLEKKGLITREPGTGDRRIKHLVLTKKAISIKTKLIEAVDEFDRELLQQVTKEEQAQMKRTLRKILEYATN